MLVIFLVLRGPQPGLLAGRMCCVKQLLGVVLHESYPNRRAECACAVSGC